MRKKDAKLFFAAIAAIIFSVVVSKNIAQAYALNTATTTSVTTTAAKYLSDANSLLHNTSSLPAAPSWLTEAINSTRAWFDTVIAQGGQSTGAPQLSNEATGALGAMTTNIHRGFQNFDTWFAGIFHFHIAIVLNIIFGIIIWVLGFVQGIVNWFAALFK